MAPTESGRARRAVVQVSRPLVKQTARRRKNIPITMAQDGLSREQTEKNNTNETFRLKCLIPFQLYIIVAEADFIPAHLF